jgi:hypothetical protein
MADPKIIEAPDGTELEFPADMPDDAIATIMAEQFPPTNYAEMSAALSPIDLSIARGKNNAFGAYLRAEAKSRDLVKAKRRASAGCTVGFHAQRWAD